jgi:predicted ATPase
VISRIEAPGYRCLEYVRQDLLPFHVLVGPNASGKSTFLDGLAFMADLVYLGPAEAVSRRAPDVRDLTWMRRGDHFELAVEVALPEERRERLKQGSYTGARYEVSVGLSRATDELAILAETFWLMTDNGMASAAPVHRTLFPQPPSPPASILLASPLHGMSQDGTFSPFS